MKASGGSNGEPENDIRVPLHEHLVGRSEVIVEVRDLVARLAPSDLIVLITGESGTGKDIVARMLHKQSPRATRPFIKFNCPAVPESIFESELFGYERGAFTGAHASKPGRFELANQGTMFLDEIAEIPQSVQGKLLQILDGEPVMRVGGTTPVQADVRIIAATNVALDDAMRDKHFREDIFFRLSEVHVHMPALRERPEDIPLLTEHFNYHYCRRFAREYEAIDADALAAMAKQEWPGNVRELAARVKKYVATGTADALLEPEESPGGSRDEPDREPPIRPSEDLEQTSLDSERAFPSLKEAVRAAVESTERALIEEALRYTLWNRRKAARLLGISYSSLLRRIEAYGMGKGNSG